MAKRKSQPKAKSSKSGRAKPTGQSRRPTIPQIYKALEEPHMRDKVRARLDELEEPEPLEPGDKTTSRPGKLRVEYFPKHDILEVDGIKYSGEFFRQFTAPKGGCLYRLRLAHVSWMTEDDVIVWIDEIKDKDISILMGEFQSDIKRILRMGATR